MKRTALFSLAAAVAAAAALTACSSASTEEEAVIDESAIGTKNLSASAFGLTDKELVLTLDDGPGPRTVELAEWLAAEKVPAVFFMVGKNARANPAAVKRVSDLSKANDGLFIIANHSMTHSGTPLPRMGTEGALREIMDADDVLEPSIASSQSVGYPNAVSFFRPPYGAFVSLGAANIARINEAGAAKYVGPVFWDIGGELANGYAADWACWGKVSVSQCTDGYVNETLAKKRGVILAHDVHSRTVDMLVGTGQAGGRSLIKELRQHGFKFVGIRSHEAAVQTFGQQQEQLSSSAEAVIDATVTTSGTTVKVDARVEGGAAVLVALDGGRPLRREPGAITLESQVAPGQHYVTISVLDAAGVEKRQERYPFIISAAISATSAEATSPDNCVAFDALRAGQKLRLYHGKIACGTEFATAVEGTTDCYRYQGELTASRDPELAGAREWSLDFDLGYAADARDRSKVGLVMDADSGEMDAARRYWPGATRPDVTMHIGAADCGKGLFRGTFAYANGTSEDLVIVAPRR